MKLCFLIFAILTFTFQVKAEEALGETFYRKVYETFSGDNCDKPKKGDCSQKSMAAGNHKDLQNFSEDDFFMKLGEAEMSRLKCGQDYWRSLSSSGPLATKAQRKENQITLIKTYEKAFPALNDLKTKINALTTLNTALHGKIVWSQKPSDVEKDVDQKTKRLEYTDREKQIKELNAVYEMTIAQLPHSDMPTVREFIEDHAGPTFFRRESKKISFNDLDKMVDQTLGAVTNNVGSLARQMQSRSFTTDQREYMATDSYLVSEITKSNPDSLSSISKYQCLAKNRATGKQIVSTGITVASLALPAGSAVLAKVGRVAFLSKFPRLASGLTSASRVMSYGNVLLNAYQIPDNLIKICFKGDAAKIVGSCSQTPKTILEESQRGQCIQDLVIQAMSMGGTLVANRLADKNSELAKFVEKMKANSRNRDLNLASNLTNTERVAVSEMILGRDLSEAQSKALIAAHEVGAGFGKYTPEDIELKRKLLKDAGFGSYETELLMWKGLAGKMEDIQATVPLAKQYGSKVFGRQLSSEQAQSMVEYTYRGDAKKEKLEALKASGFSESEIDFIVNSNGTLSGTYSRPAGEVVGNVASTAKTAMTTTATPPPATPPPPPAAPVSTNPMVVDPSRSNVQRDLLYSASEGSSSVTQTSARMYLEQYGKANNIAGASVDERRFKTMEAVVNNTVKDIEDAKKALTTVSPGGATYNQLQKNLPEMKKRCQGLTNLARTAGMTGAGFLSGIEAKIKAACGN